MAELPTQVVLGFLGDLNDSRLAEAFDRVDPDATFWLAGRNWSVGGIHDREGLLKLLAEKVGALLVEPLQVKIAAITAEGERVAVEVEVSGPTKDGRRYENQMHILYVVRDGKIVVVKEYHDTLHASLILGP